MSRGNVENLLKPDDLTPEQRRENARKAGKASAEAKKRRKAMRESLEVLLNLGMSEGEITDPETVKCWNELQGKNITVQDAVLVKQIMKAVKGDTKAAEFVRDTSGNRPTNEQRMDVAVDNGFIEALNAAVEEVEQCSSGSH
jgi:hypothetical protein|nr:MAG TPA: hypothetical protein [Caudoviricetes sp.]